MKRTLLDAAEYALRTEADALAQFCSVLTDDQVENAVKLLASAHRIAVSGCGHSGIASQHFAHLLCCIDRPARFLSPSEAVHGGMGFLHEGDALVLVSRGGKTSELLPMCRIAKAAGVNIITVTEDMTSPLAQDADVVLPLRITHETDPYNSQGTTSFVVTCALFDAIQCALIDYTGFQNEQFARIHPGGAVGERLNSKKA